MDTLGERLRKLRKEKTTNSMKEFGKIFGLSESAIGMYERNERKPDYQTLEKIADYLDTSVGFLITGKDDNGEDHSSTYNQYNNKEEKDIAKRLEEFKKEIEKSDGLAFDGEPMSEEAKESLIESMEHIFRQTQRINKKYIPNKYKENEDKD